MLGKLPENLFELKSRTSKLASQDCKIDMSPDKAFDERSKNFKVEESMRRIEPARQIMNYVQQSYIVNRVVDPIGSEKRSSFALVDKSSQSSL